MRAHAVHEYAAHPLDHERSLTVLRAVRNFWDQAPELRPWSLKFKDGWLEQRFQDEYFDTNLQYIRIATILGAITWAALGPLAPLVVQEGSLARAALIRYGLGMPTGLVSFALTHLPNYRRIWQPLLTAAILFSGLVWVIHRALIVDSRPDWARSVSPPPCRIRSALTASRVRRMRRRPSKSSTKRSRGCCALLSSALPSFSAHTASSSTGSSMPSSSTRPSTDPTYSR